MSSLYKHFLELHEYRSKIRQPMNLKQSMERLQENYIKALQILEDQELLKQAKQNNKFNDD